MRRAWAFVAMIAAAGTVPGALRAQSTPPRSDPPASIPKDKLPPKGMCRVWVDGVPAARQPAPTDCASAVRNRPPNARVIFPDEGTPDRQVERPRTTERQAERPKSTERRETRPPVRPTTTGRGSTTRKVAPPDTTRRRKPPA